MARLLVTRPEPHATGTAAALRALGHDVVLSPMLHVEPCRDVPIDLDGVAALALTSRTAVTATAALIGARADLAPMLRMPVFTVGASTAEAAKAAGFTRVLSADGAVDDLAALIRRHLTPADGAVLHPGGTERAGDLAGLLARDGIAVATVVVYEAVQATRLTDEAARALAAGGLDAVLVYSARTADALVKAAAAAGLTAELSRLPCLGLSAAALAPLDAVDLRVAQEPNETALFALVTMLGISG